MRIGATLLSGLALLLITAVWAAPLGWLAGLGLPLEGGWAMVSASRPAYLFQALLLALIWWPALDGRTGEIDPGLRRLRKWVLWLTAAVLLVSVSVLFYTYAVAAPDSDRLVPEEVLLALAMFIPLSVFVYLLLRSGESRPVFVALAGVGALMGLGGWLWLGLDLIPVRGERDLMIVGWLAIEVMTIQMVSWAAITVSLIILGRVLAFKTSRVSGPVCRPARALLLSGGAAGAGLVLMALWVWQASVIHYERQPVTQPLRTLRVGDLSIKIPESTERIIWNTNIHRPVDQAGPPLQLMEFFFEEAAAADSEFEKVLDKERSTRLTPSSGRISWEDVSHVFNLPAHLIIKPYRRSGAPGRGSGAGAGAVDELRYSLLLRLPEGYLKLNEATWWQPDQEMEGASPEARQGDFLALAQKVISAYHWEGASAERPEAGFKTKFGRLDSSRLPGTPETAFVAVWPGSEGKYNFDVRINPSPDFVAHRPPIFSDRMKVVIGDGLDYRVKSVKGLPGHERIDIIGSPGSEITYVLLKWADSGPVQGSYAPSLSLGLAGGTGNEAPEPAEILSLWEALLDGVRAAGRPENN